MTTGRIQLRRGLFASLVLADLLQGEMYYATDTKQLYISNGDGTAFVMPSAAAVADLQGDIDTLQGASDSGNSVYVSKDAATDATFTVAFPKNITGFMLYATWDGKKIFNVGRYIQGVAQNSVSNFDNTGAYTFNSAQIAVLYLDGGNYVALVCSGIADNVATIVQSHGGTTTGTLRLIFVPA